MVTFLLHHSVYRIGRTHAKNRSLCELECMLMDSVTHGPEMKISVMFNMNR